MVIRLSHTKNSLRRRLAWTYSKKVVLGCEWTIYDLLSGMIPGSRRVPVSWKVRGDDAASYILRHTPHDDRWELTLIESRPW